MEHMQGAWSRESNAHQRLSVNIGRRRTVYVMPDSLAVFSSSSNWRPNTVDTMPAVLTDSTSVWGTPTALAAAMPLPASAARFCTRRGHA
jgi:hypothetical protein